MKPIIKLSFVVMLLVGALRYPTITAHAFSGTYTCTAGVMGSCDTSCQQGMNQCVQSCPHTQGSSVTYYWPYMKQIGEVKDGNGNVVGYAYEEDYFSTTIPSNNTGCMDHCVSQVTACENTCTSLYCT